MENRWEIIATAIEPLRDGNIQPGESEAIFAAMAFAIGNSEEQASQCTEGGPSSDFSIPETNQWTNGPNSSDPAAIIPLSPLPSHQGHLQQGGLHTRPGNGYSLPTWW